MRKNKFLIIALLGYSIIALAGCAKPKIKNIDSKGKNIICFGDSITFGYGADTGEDYPSLLAKMVNIPVINAGVSADTSSDGLARIQADVLDKQPLLVIIEFAANDFIKKIPVSTTLNNIKEMTDKIQANGAMVALADASAGMILGGYRPGLYRIAQEKGAIFIPGILKGIITNPGLKSDFIHPNAKGYDMIAHKVYRRVSTYLKNSKGIN